jgi:uncharacterized SAM-binding protein YcdF (DUF218 family)
VFSLFAKIVWFLAQPSTLMVAAVAAGVLLSATRWKRAGGRLVIFGVLALILAGLSPLADLLILPLENRFPRADLVRDARPVAGIIVLGGAEDSRATPPRELAGLNEAAERYTEAVALARRFPQARLVFSGGYGAVLAAGPPEADNALRLFTALGIGADRVTLEDRSRDTYENAHYTARLIKPVSGGGRWLLITSGWHMPRAVGCFRRAGLAVEAWPVDYRTSGRFEPLRWNSSIPEGLRRLDFATREYAGLLIYYLTGRTTTLLPGP